MTPAPTGDVFLAMARAAGKPLARVVGRSAGPRLPELAEAALGRAAAEARPFDFHRMTSGDVPGRRWRLAATTDRGNGRVEAEASNAVRLRAPEKPPETPAEAAELWPWGSIMLFDGRLANRGWIQEAPDPVTFIAWGNWLDVHPDKADRLRLKQNDVAEITTAAGKIEASVRITDEVTKDMVAISFGQGHRAMGRNAPGIGANAFTLLGAPGDGSVFASCRIRKKRGERDHDPTWTAPTRDQSHREILQWMPLSELSRMAPGQGDNLVLPLPEGYPRDKNLYPKREYKAHRWAMVIDIHRCIGCGACAVACYAENNIAVMGKKQVDRQLEMAWLRVPPYRKPEGGATLQLAADALPALRCGPLRAGLPRISPRITTKRG